MVLTSELTKIVDEVDLVLRRKFGKQLFYPKSDDQIRLLRLHLWSERYKVSLEYILSVLIPYFEGIANKHRGRPRGTSSKGIGTTIANLTGNASENILLSRIEKDFPESEHKIDWRITKQQACLQKIAADSDEVVVKRPKGVLQYATLAKYRKAYEQRITQKKMDDEKLERQLAKQPFRGNPFR